MPVDERDPRASSPADQPSHVPPAMRGIAFYENVFMSEIEYYDALGFSRQIHDPEMPVNIYDLGLIYGLEVDPQGRVDIRMTLTAPGCPVAGSFPGLVESYLRQLDGVSEARVELVWDPPWDQERMSEDARLALGLM